VIYSERVLRIICKNIEKYIIGGFENGHYKKNNFANDCILLIFK